MAWTGYQKILVSLLIITGSINTLSTKWADLTSSKGSDDQERPFQHPVLQSTFMFFGEALCLLFYQGLLHRYGERTAVSTHIDNLISGNGRLNSSILIIPALLDFIGTTIMYIGLNLTYASSFQMFRGSIIVFTALLSVIFLRKDICVREWSGIVTVIFGLIIIGASDFMNRSETYGPNRVLTGDMLIVIAQIISAMQMVYEEHYIKDSDVSPLQAIGWEGVYGFGISVVFHFIFYNIPGIPFCSNNPRNSFEDPIDGLIQIANNNYLIAAVIMSFISIAFFNFAGISITKEISATTRMVLDCVRTLVIWAVSLGLGWQEFYWTHLLGFIILLVGLCIYNDIFINKLICFFKWIPNEMSTEEHIQSFN